ncbi:MAG: hypothetical protein RL693_2565 [Verrucomicrobiota bacterium]
MKRIFSISLICFSVFAADISPTLDEAVKSYAQLHQMTPAPHFVYSKFIALCGAAASDNLKVSSHIESAVKVYPDDPDKYGPHVDGVIRIYMNDSAQNTFLTTSKNYPVGSVIIKEKIWGHTKTGEPDLGGMIKRKHSEKPSVDDWEFFYKEAGKKPSSARMESCKDCHANAASKDFVFGNWLELSLKKVEKAVIPLPDPPINPLLND